LEKLLKTLTRTVVLECYANRVAGEALRDIVEPLKTMIGEMVEYALEHNASWSIMHPRKHYIESSTRGIGGSTRGCQQGL
jgi:hypothetical protein